MNEEDDRTRLSSIEDMTVLSANGGTALSSTEDATILSSGTVSSSWPAGEGQRLTPGQEFGPYSIVKLLGHGGMGEVYEAVQIETGRRVALKLLRGMMVQHEDRARFLREGRLAASISHPHTVYIFGSEEIGGMPVISMQLLPGGTLKDRVVEGGAMPTAEAVAAILDVIGGLDAAASAGILHRDIKPSNCFVDVDGSVKVGDFGLSIATSARDAGATKGFQGTPQYAAPEQLRGDPLDVRADIYAVGASLFYLLTGKPPFEARDFQQLVEQVQNSAAPLAHKVRPGIPSGLSALIVRCLDKNPAGRPSSYADLASALRPFSNRSIPARRGIRLVAGIIDTVIIGIPVAILKAGVQTGAAARAAANASVDPWTALFSLLYFGISEGRWGTTIGKRTCGLRVVATSGEMSWRQGAARALIFMSPQLPLLLLAFIFGSQRVADYLASHGGLAAAAAIGPMILSALLYSTMRRGNGLAAVHDLLTQTRVVMRRSDEFRQGASADSTEFNPLADGGITIARFGSFAAGRILGDVPGGRLLEGIDTVLKRRVWLLESAPGAAETPRVRRDVDRVGRLHWLAGKRSPDENWDAYEAPQGAALDPTPGASSWKSVEGWLNDLVAELVASERDKSTPALSLDRVWIRQDGRAVLLDFPAPTDHKAGHIELSPGLFLATIGRLALKGPSPMPVSAVAMLDRWAKAEKKAPLPLATAQADLVAASVSPEKVSRGRRLLPIGLGAAPVVAMMIGAVFAIKQVQQQTSATSFGMLAVLEAAKEERSPRYREAFETYLAGTYRADLADEAAWKERLDDDDDKEIAPLYELARRAAVRQPTPEQTAEAAYFVQPALDKIEATRANRNVELIFVTLVLVGAGMSFFGGLVSVLVRPSGVVLSALGLAVVARSGREISRFHAVLRLLIAWSPVAVLGILMAVPQTRQFVSESMVPGGIALALVAIGTIWTVLRPTRGPHDIIARTTIGVR